MAEITGVLTTLNHQLPAGVDPTRLAQWRLRDGQTYDQVRANIVASLDGLNREILEAWGDLIYVTTDDSFEYPNGGSIGDMPKLTDLDRPQPRKADTIGHMLGLDIRGDAVGGTEVFFRDARTQVLNANVAQVTQAGRNTFERDLMTRAMTTTENMLGTSGYDVPFANANPGSLTYIPPQYNGKTFTGSHTHYLGIASGSKGYDNMLDELAETLHEHGHPGPYIALVAEADVTGYRALADFVKPISNQIVIVDRGGATSGANLFQRGGVAGAPPTGAYKIGSYISPFGEVELRATSRIPTKYAFMYKSYGINNERNPIAIRVHPDVGFGFRIKEIPSYDTTWPVKLIEINIEYGVSCGMSRTSGAAGFRDDGGTWSNPTIN